MEAFEYPKIEVVYELLFDDAKKPEYQTDDAVGGDLYAYVKDRTISMRGPEGEVEEVVNGPYKLIIQPGWTALIPLGFKATLPMHLQGELRLRSSVGFKHGLFMPNSPGTVDPKYPGEWLVTVSNYRNVATTIGHLERFAQVVLMPFVRKPWVPGKVRITTNRVGGVGSTGSL